LFVGRALRRKWWRLSW